MREEFVPRVGTACWRRGWRHRRAVPSTRASGCRNLVAAPEPQAPAADDRPCAATTSWSALRPSTNARADRRAFRPRDAWSFWARGESRLGLRGHPGGAGHRGDGHFPASPTNSASRRVALSLKPDPPRLLRRGAGQGTRRRAGWRVQIRPGRESVPARRWATAGAARAWAGATLGPRTPPTPSDEKLRRLQRLLRRGTAPPAFRRRRTRLAALHASSSLHQMPLEIAGGASRRDGARPAVQAFHDEFTWGGTGARDGSGCTCLLLDGHAPPAALYGLAYGRAFFFYQSGFDPAFCPTTESAWSPWGWPSRPPPKRGWSSWTCCMAREPYKQHWGARVAAGLLRVEAWPPGTRRMDRTPRGDAFFAPLRAEP